MSVRKKKKPIPITPSDKSFFECFYQRNIRFIFYIAGKYAEAEDREDLVQDTIERLLGNITKLRGLTDQKAKKYIALTVRTAFLDNEKKRNSSGSTEWSVPPADGTTGSNSDSLDDIHGHTAWSDVEQLKKELPSRDWLILEGKYILGSTQEELGKQIGVSPDSIRMITRRAREKARLILHPEKGKEDDSHE